MADEQTRLRPGTVDTNSAHNGVTVPAAYRLIKRAAIVVLLLVLALLTVLPAIAGSRFTITFAMLAMIWMGAALAWNILSGYTGYISLGHAAPFGVGGYAVALGTSEFGFPIGLSMVIAVVLSGLLSLVLGGITLRLSGAYFAIATLGIAEVFRVGFSAYRQWTGGVIGVYLPMDIVGAPVSRRYYAILGIFALSLLLAWLLHFSRLGIRLLAIGQDEGAAESLGVNTSGAKVLAFTLSGALTGAFGGCYMWVLGFIDPNAVFQPVVSLQIAIMAIIGGGGTILGPLLGAAVLYAGTDWISLHFTHVHLIVYGASLVLAMLFLRDGLMGALRRSAWWPTGVRV